MLWQLREGRAMPRFHTRSIMKRWLKLVLFALASAIAAPLGATAVTTDQSDVWWVPSESGWGAELVQRGSTVVATIYVYDPTGVAIWYNAALVPTGTPYVWSGDLYVYSGPWLGTSPFNPAAVRNRKVGTMTWYGQYVNAGTLTYSVDGVVVTKNLERASFAIDDYSGTFKGALNIGVTGCSNPANNGSGEGFSTFTVVQNGQSIGITSAAVDGSGFSFSGTLTPSGQFGIATGAYSTTAGEIGTATFFEMNVQINTFSARFTSSGTNTGCQSVGYLGGIRHR
jgi:hypothetical protein